jgi:hypothetical protein
LARDLASPGRPAVMIVSPPDEKTLLDLSFLPLTD